MQENSKRLTYKTESDNHKSELLKSDLTNSLLSLQNTDTDNKVNWRDINDVKTRTYNYLSMCAEKGLYPSVMGLCAYGFGVSRNALYKFCKQNPNTETAEYIERVKDCFADILVNASLYNNANAVQVIFQLKNHFEHTDKIEVTPVNTTDIDLIPPEKLIESIQDLPIN